MQMTLRDRQIILAVGRFGQLASGHVRDLFFGKNKSDTPSKRRLRELTEQGYLRLVERRPVGGAGRGSGQAVYQLGTKGWTLCRREGKYWPFRAISLHRLAIADAYVAVKQLEKTGRYEVVYLDTEPDTHVTIAGAELTPDLHVELRDKALGEDHLWWLEVDMGTERQAAIKDKFARYWHAYENVTADVMPDWPHVVFLAPDEERAADLRRWIKQGSEEAQHLFKVELQTSFPQALMTL
jgi:hypothetical protein